MEKVVFINKTLCLTITVKGYEYPSTPNRLDANWLVVEIALKVGNSWFCNEWPLLETREIGQIADWFDALSYRRLPRWVRLDLTEPNLAFAAYKSTDEAVRFGVCLSHESCPPSGFVADSSDYVAGSCNFEMTYTDLAKTAAIFRKLETVFSIRSGLGMTDKQSQHAVKMLNRRFATVGR